MSMEALHLRFHVISVPKSYYYKLFESPSHISSLELYYL